MPPAKHKPSEIAADAKKSWIPYLRDPQNNPDWSLTSFLCYSDYIPPRLLGDSERENIRFAFYDRDPIDVALDWAASETFKIPVIMPANDKRPGGDWEAGVMSPEECLCRRSTLYANLTTPGEGNPTSTNYPIPEKCGIYSRDVVVFRDGPEKYETWTTLKSLPIISVCPVKRPKLDSAGRKYSFKQEKELMREKIATALRIAVYYEHKNLCIGSFGLGSGFRNPTEEVALMWRDALIGQNSEFYGHFGDVVFAFENPEGSASSSKGSSSKGSSSKSSKSSSSKSSSSKSSSSSAADLDIFRDVFKPSKIHGISAS